MRFSAFGFEFSDFWGRFSVFRLLSYFKKEQRDEFNRHQINQTESNLSETKRLENELKDAQIAFELFQAESRKDFEAVLEEQKKEHEKQNEVLLKEAEAKFQAKLRSRLQDQRLEIESDYNDMLLQIENKQKQEIERMASKLAGAKDEMVSLRGWDFILGHLHSMRVINLERFSVDYLTRKPKLKVCHHVLSVKCKKFVTSKVKIKLKKKKL